MGVIPIGEVLSDNLYRVDLDPFEPDGGFGLTPLQEPAGVNGVVLSKRAWGQSVEYEFQFLIGRVKRIGHPQEDRVQSGPALNIDPRIDFCGQDGEIRLECDLPDAIGGDCLENRFDPVTWLSELDEAESHLFEAFAWG